MELLVSMLKKFGLNTNEAKVYTTLLVHNDARASDIARNAKIPRNKLYEIAESLNKKGFVEVIPEKVMKFRAIPFESVCEMQMKSWQQQLEEISKIRDEVMQRLKKISEPHDEKSYFAVFRSRKAIRKKFEDMINSGERVLLVLNISDIRNLVNIAKKASKNAEIDVMVPINKDNLELVKKWMRFADVRHYETSMQEKMAITENSVLIFEFSSPLALYSNDAKFASMFQSFLEAEWTVAASAEEKIMEIETGKLAEDIVFMRGRKNFFTALPDFFKELKKDLVIMTTQNGIIRIHKYLGKYLDDARSRGVSVRVITVVTKNNVEAARNIKAEVRHVDKVHSVTSCFDNQMLCMLDLKDDSPDIGSPDDIIMIINNKNMVKMMRYMLESVWADAEPLATRIAEIEEGKKLDNEISEWEKGVIKSIE
ncbi:MAG: helix-turn-helix domain-containing protein [Nanoarchaeota archaeon]